MIDTSHKKEIIQSIFEYDHNGGNCLFAAFGMMRDYLAETKQCPNSSIDMYNEIESLIIYFLRLAEQYNVDLEQVINYTNEGGQSIFHLAILFTEKVSSELIRRNVKVNKIDNRFSTPYFMVN